MFKPSFCVRLLILLPLLFLMSCRSDLYTRLTENEANEIVALLMRNGISANRVAAKDGTSIVRVEESSISDAVTLLNDAGLPRPKFATMGEVFADTKLISSPTEERARFIYALSQELSKTLSEIDGVISARVHLVLPKNDPLREDAKPSSASVFIKHDAAIAMVPLLPQIKTLVTNSIEGLTYDKVSVIFIPSDRVHKVTPVADGSIAARTFADISSASQTMVIGGVAAFVALVSAILALQYPRRKQFAGYLRSLSARGPESRPQRKADRLD